MLIIGSKVVQRSCTLSVNVRIVVNLVLGDVKVTYSTLTIRTPEAILVDHSEKAIGAIQFDLSVLLVI